MNTRLLAFVCSFAATILGPVSHHALGYEVTLVNSEVAEVGIAPETLQVETEAQTLALPLSVLSSVRFFHDEDRTRLQLSFPSGHLVQGNLLKDRVAIVNAAGVSLPTSFSNISEIRNTTFAEPAVPTETLAAEIFHVDGSSSRANILFSMLEMKSAFGVISIPVSNITELRKDVGGSSHTVETVFQERFTGKILSKSLFMSDVDGTASKFSLSDARIVRFNTKSVSIPEGLLVWQHRAGDRFLGKGREDLLSVAPVEGEELFISTAAISLMQRDVDGLYKFQSSDESIVASPTEFRLELATPYALNMMSFKWKDIVGGANRGAPPTESLLSFASAVAPVVTPAVASEVQPTVPQDPEPDFSDEPSDPVEPRDPSIEVMREVEVRGGSFQLGRSRLEGEGLDDEVPAVTVTVSSYYMDETEVTVAQFREFTLDEGFITEAERDLNSKNWQDPGFKQGENFAVVWVSWNDAIEFCNWRSVRAGLDPCYSVDVSGLVTCDRSQNGYRLPTEAEWEFACRDGGSATRFPWGGQASIADAVKYANFTQKRSDPFDGYLWTAPVKAFPANRLGIHGLAGNAWEWCQDAYSESAYLYIIRAKDVDPCVEMSDAPDLSRRSMRGGSWKNDVDYLRCASRGNGFPASSANRTGFRCVRNVR